MADSVSLDIRHHLFSDGRRLAWRQTGQGAPLVMLHGWSMSGAVFHEIAAAFADDHTVLCPDLTGHGGSDPAAKYSLELLAADIAAWLKKLDISKCCLLGWSLGGQIAMSLAVRSELSVRKLILVSTTPCFCQNSQWRHGLPRGQVLAMIRQLNNAYLKTLGDFFDLQFSGEQLTEDRRRELLLFAVRSSQLPQPDSCLAVLESLSKTDCRSWLRSIDCPVLITHGVNDEIIPCSAGRFLAEQLIDSQLHLLEDVGHAPFMSRPDECINLWRDFLK